METTRTSLAAAGARYAIVAMIGLALVGSFVFVTGMMLNVDETFHYPQIVNFLRHDFRQSPALTMLPGYHFAVFAVASVFGLSSVVAIRFISFCISLLSIAVFHLLAQHLRANDADSKTLQYVFSPLLYPFFFVIYTDVTSLLMVTLGVLLTLRKQYYMAGLVGLLACLVRQNNIIWVGLMFLLMAADALRERNAIGRQRFWEPAGNATGLGATVAKRGAVYLAGFALFVVFVIINKGVAVGDTERYPSFTLHPENVYCMLFTFFFLFLPMNIANVEKIGRLLRRNRLAVVYAAGFFVLFMATFDITHPYNTEPWAQWFVSNRILSYFLQSPLHKALFFLPILWSVLSLSCTRLYAREFYLIYPLSIVALLPLWHVDPRYFLPPFVLFLLFKEDDSRPVQLITGLFYAGASGYFLHEIVTYEYFF